MTLASFSPSRDAVVADARSGCYVLFGRTLRCPLPLALPPGSVYRPPAVVAEPAFRPLPPGGRVIDEAVTPAGDLVYSVRRTGNDFVWTYPRAGSFCIGDDGTRVEWWSDSPDVVALLSGPILGFALQLQNLNALHANVVVSQGEAFALLGSSGVGKSTLTAAFMRMGASLLSDDLLVVEEAEGQMMALPGPARLKLWPESLGHVIPDSLSNLAPVVSWLDKRTVPAAMLGDNCTEKRPLRAVFLLVPVIASASVALRRLTGPESVAVLLGNTYLNHLLPRDQELRTCQLLTTTHLAESVPLFSVLSPRAFDRLEETASAIAAQLEDLRPSKP